jgi:hypothetical protein
VHNRLHWLFCNDPCCSDRREKPKQPKVKPREPRLSGWIDLKFTLTDDDSTPIDASIAWSADRLTWRPCDPSKGITLRRLVSSPQGVRHTYSWDSLRHLGARRVRVWFKVQIIGRDCLYFPAVIIDNRCLSSDGE